MNGRPETDIIPEIGSTRCSLNPVYWATVSAKSCLVCGLPMGGGTWGIHWGEDWAHLHCWEERLEKERKLGDNPWLSEESSKRMKMSIAQFRGLPNYERIKANRESANQREKIEAPKGRRSVGMARGS